MTAMRSAAVNMILASIILTGYVGYRGNALACSTNQYECNNGKCIPLARACDHHDDCGDGSDEIRHETGFKCEMGAKKNLCVLPQRLLNDTVAQCSDGTDLCPVKNGAPSCQKCLTGSNVIKVTQLCDGVIDCPDLSDECPCEVTSARSLCTKLKAGNTLMCDNGTTSLDRSWVCDGVIDCKDSSDELHCRQTSTSKIVSCRGLNGTKVISAFACDGVTECDDLSDECSSNCSSKPGFCSVAARYSSAAGGFSCVASGSTNINLTFTSREICDGKWLNCTPQITEEESSCPGRFYCKSLDAISIHPRKVCDGVADCDDGSDEKNCSSRFYCSGGSPVSVPNTFRMDGLNDCSDGSDECPPLLDHLGGYSSRYEMISSVALRVWLWFIALIGAAANCFVFCYTFRILHKLRSPDSLLARGNYILVMNLNVADALMSVYLLILAVKSVQFSGNYCHVELSWRTSFTCNFIGPLSMLSAEVSLFTLVAMTSQRLYAVFYPIQAKVVRLCYVTSTLIGIWALSFVLAAVPAMNPNVFVDGLWLPSKFFSQPIVKSANVDLLVSVVRLITDSNTTSAAPPVGIEANERYLRARGFSANAPYGYYSENGLCVPHFYTPVIDNGWSYPTLIVTVNMAAFVYVAIAYGLIYWKSTKRRVPSSRKNDGSRRMQRRIVKLVVANFACWLPICVASYVQLAIPNEFAHPLFALTAAFLFPINSVANPLLYSDFFEVIFDRVKRGLIGEKSRDSSRNVEQTNISDVKPST